MIGDETGSSLVHSTMAKRVRMGLLILATLLAGGCASLAFAEMVLDIDTAVSFTVDPGEVGNLRFVAGEASRQFGVDTEIQAIRSGATVLRIAGAYASVVKTVEWMMGQGLELLAHDAASADFLAHALFYALK